METQSGGGNIYVCVRVCVCKKNIHVCVCVCVWRKIKRKIFFCLINIRRWYICTS